MPPPTRSTTSCRWRSAAPNTTRPTAGLPVPTTIAAEARGPTSRRVPDSRRHDHPQHPPHHPPSLTPIALSNYPTASVGPSASNSRITHLIPHHDDACAATLSNPPAHHPPTDTHAMIMPVPQHNSTRLHITHLPAHCHDNACAAQHDSSHHG